jgi:hypothetical protein
MLVADLRNYHELNKIETQLQSQLRGTVTENSPLLIHSNETWKRMCCVCIALTGTANVKPILLSVANPL